MVLGVLFVIALFGFAIYSSTASPAAKAKREQREQRDAKLVCPHCQTVGSVTSSPVRNKKGISGGKATGAVMTGGASLFATGLSRKENAVRMTCRNCGTVWEV